MNRAAHFLAWRARHGAAPPLARFSTPDYYAAAEALERLRNLQHAAGLAQTPRIRLGRELVLAAPFRRG